MATHAILNFRYWQWHVFKWNLTCGTLFETCLAAEASIFAATWDIFIEITAFKCKPFLLDLKCGSNRQYAVSTIYRAFIHITGLNWGSINIYAIQLKMWWNYGILVLYHSCNNTVRICQYIIICFNENFMYSL